MAGDCICIQNMPSVLMIGPDYSSQGGMATVERQYFDAGLEKYCRVHFIPTYKDGTKLKKLIVAMVAMVRFIAHASSFDIAHIHMASDASHTRKRAFVKCASFFNMKVVLHIHSGDLDTYYEENLDDSGREKYRDTLSRSDVVVALSNEWKAYIQQCIQYDGRIEVLKNTVPVPSNYPAKCKNHNVLFLGRLGERKSPDVLIEAMSSVCKRFPDAKAFFAGDGDIENYCMLSEKLGVSDNCVFLGWLTGNDLAQLYEKCSVFCLPSKNEGQPMSVLESMAHGLAVVVTPVGGIPSIIQGGKNGILVPVGDSSAVSKALIDLFSDEERCSNLQREGYETVKRDYSIEAGLAELLTLYRSIYSANVDC